MNEKEAIEYVKGLGGLKFNYLSDNTVTYEAVNPKYIDGELYNIKVCFYIKEGVTPTIFCYDNIERINLNHFQLAEIMKVNLGVLAGEIYFSKYKE